MGDTLCFFFFFARHLCIIHSTQCVTFNTASAGSIPRIAQEGQTCGWDAFRMVHVHGSDLHLPV